MRLLLTLFLMSSFSLFSQSTLESEINRDGILFPRMTTVDRDALSAVKGQCIFNINTNEINCFDGMHWDKTKYLSLSPLAVVSDNNLNTGISGAFYAPAAPDLRSIDLPVVLPHGCEVTKMIIHYSDTDVGNQIRFTFFETILTTGSGNAIIDVSKDGTYLTGEMKIEKVIDNFKHSYAVSFEPITIPLDNKFVLHGVVFEYIE